VRCFVEPLDDLARRKGIRSGKTMVQFFTPSYSLYPVLADTHGAVEKRGAVENGFFTAIGRGTAARRQWNLDAALTLVTTPNAPSGRAIKLPRWKNCAARRTAWWCWTRRMWISPMNTR